jgi:hypothetical protein
VHLEPHWLDQPDETFTTPIITPAEPVDQAREPHTAVGEGDVVEFARQRGRDAHQAGVKKRAIPLEYRNPLRAREAAAWMEGWHDSQLQNGLVEGMRGGAS